MKLSKEELWDLRKQITLCSLFSSDYHNFYGITPESCINFFEGYADDLGEQMRENNIDADCFYENISKYDTADNLWNYYNCFEEEPFEFDEVN